MYEINTGLVKPRTCLTNYAPVYSAMEYIYGIFKPVYEHLGYDWEDFLTFARTEHCEQMQILHVETDDAKSYVRRYCLGLLEWCAQQPIQKRLQHLRMVNSKKIKCGYALGVAPASESSLKHLKGAILPLVKQHVLAIGGRVDSPEDHITVALLKDSLDLPEDVEEVNPQGEWSTNKRGILIPGDCLPSSLWLDLCKVLNQHEKFGSVDEVSYFLISCEQSIHLIFSGISHRNYLAFRLFHFKGLATRVDRKFQKKLRFKAGLLIYSPNLHSRQVIVIYAFLANDFQEHCLFLSCNNTFHKLQL